MQDLAKDGGVYSRKMWFCVGASLAIMICGWTMSSTTLPTVVDGLVWIAAIFAGGNVGVKVAAAVAATRGAKPAVAKKPPVEEGS